MKKNKSEKLKSKRGITLIALVITIIVLIILAAISLMMLSGNDGILNRAGNGKQIQGQATIEEEVKRAILALQIDGKGKNNDITPAKVAEQVNKDNGRTDVTAEGDTFPTNIVFPKENSKVYVNLDLSIGKKDDSGSGGGTVIVDGVYSEDVDESEVAPDDIFIKEVISSASNNTQVASENGVDKLPTATARIKGIKDVYLYGMSTSLGENQYGINYEGITNKLVIPAQVEIDGNMYKVVEVNLSQDKYSDEYSRQQKVSLPNIETIIYPNTVEKIYGESDLYSRGNFTKIRKIVLPEKITEIPKNFCKNFPIESIEIPKNVKTIGESAFEGTALKNSITIYGNIGKKAFYGCYGLHEVTISNGTNRIEEQAFARCSQLNKVTIPESIIYIGGLSFSDHGENFVLNINKNKAFLDSLVEYPGFVNGDTIILNDETIIVGK